MSSAKPPPGRRGTPEQEVTAGLGWSEMALLHQGREFCCRAGDAEIPAHPSGWDVGRWGCVSRAPGTGWVLGAIPLLSAAPPLSPSFSSPFPFSSRFSSHTPPLSSSPGPHIPTHWRPFRPSNSFKGIQEAPGAPAHQIKLKFAAYMQTRCVWTPGLCWHTQRVNRNTWLSLEEQQLGLRALGRGFNQIWGAIVTQSTPKGALPGVVSTPVSVARLSWRAQREKWGEPEVSALQLNPKPQGQSQTGSDPKGESLPCFLFWFIVQMLCST